MAYRSVRISDLTGAEGKDEDFITLAVRRYPGLEEPVQIDVLAAEIKGLKSADQLVVLEVRNGGEPQRVVTTKAEFDKLAPNIQEVLANADGLRGRRKGFRPTASKDD
ncbi:hypothetical protein JQN58_31475 [Aneurinibacillus sp. BA2021]|nr:hypothetical protein [Aneurinibacillus sp. BA2021]